MPSERRTSRGRRSRSKSRALRGERIRLRACEAENLSMASPPGSSSPGRQAVMAAMPQASWRTPLRGLRRAGTRYSVVKTWAQKHLRLLMLAGLALLLLGYYLSPGFSDSVSPSQYVQWSNENASGQSLEKTSAWEALLSFFFPTKPTQMFRMFGLSVISMIILGCLPIYCCSLCRRSKWGNHLRRKVNRILKGLKKQRNKLKEDTEVLGAIMEDEEGLGDEKEQN
ncbi:FMR1 neighbor protein isoform X1 [Diceros bicornis minor]|uniref:FMR1 neighbor protein isoform X1 n=1 Tax=Diceros bicornis minor TaxID=77932 RepID=UPI0026EBCAB5|nr:FMR1 neighbor protein isoform X1 [Diceros bicornis minor]